MRCCVVRSVCCVVTVAVSVFDELRAQFHYSAVEGVECGRWSRSEVRFNHSQAVMVAADEAAVTGHTQVDERQAGGR